ncbi:AtpZ/AtpI family protein [Marinomonas primoryensis]|jgi:ATP synthase protein I|uniref:AtpZ/AtpI family protein n=1 Tax=Marinomonas primoryensis TaxID=178399 RepID=UPI0030D72A27|tara:strand:- start:2432 stop:2797 length:366 start_codon:yes stop_codon:yes gene_type:complete
MKNENEPDSTLKKKSPSSDSQQNYSQQVGDMASRKLKAQRHVNKTVWSGLGMMGLIGWSIAIPTVLGAGLGIWLDDLYPGGRSWTLALLVVGLCLGCFNAWHWVDKEDKDIHQHEDNNDAD